MRRNDWASENGTWHPTIVDGAHDYFFGERPPIAPDAITTRTILIGLAASTCLVFAGATDSARTTPPERSLGTRIFSPDLGEVVPVLDSIGEKRDDVSTTLALPNDLKQARSTLDRFKSEVLAWHSQLNERHIAGLNKRLDHLFEDEPESSKSQALPDLNSFGVLLAFLARHPEYKTPSIGFNRDGIFSATWMGEQKLRMSLDFISPSSIRWIYIDSRSGLKDAITGAGIVPLDVLAGVLEVYGAIGWMKS